MDSLIVSWALDTNGQNYRFVEAARKWGEDSDVLRAFAVGKDDPAGVVARFQLAAEKHGGLRIRSAHRAVQYFQFPTDLVWDRRTDPEVRKLADEADVIHLNNSYVAVQRLRIRKPMLLHHHGSMFRNNPKHMLQMAKHHKMLQAVSTIDLTRPNPGLLHWLPSAYDVDALAEFGRKHAREPDGRVRIVHCPTNRELKHTELLIAAVKALQDDGLPVDLVLVEGQTWEESLKAKAQADIVFDQLLYGYGCNSIEAWCMGKPVISGADEWTLGRMTKEWGKVPFAEADETTLGGVLRTLAASEMTRKEYGRRGQAHVRKYHDEKPALAKLAELYAKAIRHYVTPRIPGKGETVTFRSTKGKRVYLDSDPIDFTDGSLRTDDPLVIARLRTLAKRTVFGIEEVA